MKKFFLLFACLFLLRNLYAQTDTLARSFNQLNEVFQHEQDFDLKKRSAIDFLTVICCRVFRRVIDKALPAYTFIA